MTSSWDFWLSLFFLTDVVLVFREEIIVQLSQYPQKISFTLKYESFAVMHGMHVPPEYRRLLGINEPANDARLNISHEVSPVIEFPSKSIYRQRLTID